MYGISAEEKEKAKQIISVNIFTKSLQEQVPMSWFKMVYFIFLWKCDKVRYVAMKVLDINEKVDAYVVWMCKKSLRKGLHTYFFMHTHLDVIALSHYKQYQ